MLVFLIPAEVSSSFMISLLADLVAAERLLQFLALLDPAGPGLHRLRRLLLGSRPGWKWAKSL
jgi:hypothetical protein